MSKQREVDFLIDRVDLLLSRLSEPSIDRTVQLYEDSFLEIKKIIARYINITMDIIIDTDEVLTNKNKYYEDYISNLYSEKRFADFTILSDLFYKANLSKSYLGYQYYVSKEFGLAKKYLEESVDIVYRINLKARFYFIGNDINTGEHFSKEYMFWHIYALSLVENDIIDKANEIGIFFLQNTPYLSKLIFEKIFVYCYNRYGYHAYTLNALGCICLSCELIGDKKISAQLNAILTRIRNELSSGLFNFTSTRGKRRISTFQEFLSRQENMDSSDHLLEAYLILKGIALPDRDALKRKIEVLAKRSKPIKPLPAQAPERYDERPIRADIKRKEKIGEFMVRVWGEYMDPDVGPLSRKTLRKLDDSAEAGIDNWLSYHKILPEGVYLPTAPELNDAALLVESPRERNRLRSAASRRDELKK